VTEGRNLDFCHVVLLGPYADGVEGKFRMLIGAALFFNPSSFLFLISFSLVISRSFVRCKCNFKPFCVRLFELQYEHCILLCTIQVLEYSV
jgi:hypothetical protein